MVVVYPSRVRPTSTSTSMWCVYKKVRIAVEVVLVYVVKVAGVSGLDVVCLWGGVSFSVSDTFDLS